jgi:uncharacterized protein (DUF1330 family)
MSETRIVYSRQSDDGAILETELGMTVYLVTNVEVVDPERYKAYTKAGHDTVIKYGGRFLAEGAVPVPVEGSWLPKRMAIVEFPDQEAAMRFYHSPDYTAARQQRRDVANFNMIMVPGES